MTLSKLNKSIIECHQCDRLVNFRKKVATEKVAEKINYLIFSFKRQCSTSSSHDSFLRNLIVSKFDIPIVLLSIFSNCGMARLL